MARKPTTPPVKPKLELLEPTETARAKITDRIAKGELLRSGGATISPEEHAKWRSYNFTLLKGMFSTEEMAAEYKSSTFSRYVPTYFGPGQSHAVDPRESTRKLGAEITCLKSILERLEIIPVAAEVAIQEPLSPGTTERLKDTTRAFVVHGHDDAARESVARLLERLGIGAVILHEQANRGDTLVEKLERYSDVSFAVVLLTPDDEGRARGANTPLEIRARQNVILELGYFVGKLGRPNVCALYKEEVKLPSDWDGVVWIKLDDGGAWKYKLGRELQDAGFAVDMNKVN